MAIGRALSKGYQTDNAGAGRTSVHIEMPPLPEEEKVVQEIVPAVAPEQPQQEQQYEQEAEEQDPEQEEEVTDTEDEVEEVVQPKKAAQESFREIRLAKEQAERERNALMLKMQELQAEYINQIKPKQLVQEVEEKSDLDLDIDPETLVEGKHLKKYVDEMKNLRKEIKNYKQQSQESAMQNKLKSQYPDFDQVFNITTVNELNDLYPGVAQALSVIPNDYDKAVAAYEMIKNLGLSEELPMKKNVAQNAQEKAKAVTNSNKPRPLASVSPQQGDSPLSKANAFANGLTDELKEQLRKEMFNARRQH